MKNQLKKKVEKQVKELGKLLPIIKEWEINMINNININQNNKKHLIGYFLRDLFTFFLYNLKLISKSILSPYLSIFFCDKISISSPPKVFLSKIILKYF